MTSFSSRRSSTNSDASSASSGSKPSEPAEPSGGPNLRVTLRERPAKEPTLAGYLNIRSRFGTNQKWYVVIADGLVSWWANDKSYIRGVKPRSTVAPPMVAWEPIPDPESKTMFTVVRAHDRVVLTVFDADDSTHTREKWIEAMEANIRRTSIKDPQEFIGESVKASRASTRKSVRNALEHQAAAAAQKEGISVYDAAGMQVMQQRRAASLRDGKEAEASFDAIYERGWCAIYVGDLATRNSLDCLKEHGISRVVDVLEPTAFPEEERKKFDDISYVNFPIALWDNVEHSKKDETLAKIVAPLLSFVEEGLQDGESVLIHCYAGAHRSGTAGVACMMYLEDISAAVALQRAREKRPIIDSFASMDKLLRRLDRLLPQEALMSKALAEVSEDPAEALEAVFHDAIEGKAAEVSTVRASQRMRPSGYTTGPLVCAKDDDAHGTVSTTTAATT